MPGKKNVEEGVKKATCSQVSYHNWKEYLNIFLPFQGSFFGLHPAVLSLRCYQLLPAIYFRNVFNFECLNL